MKNLQVINSTDTMSSTEIAQLTGKQKTHIHRDVKEQLLFGLYGLKDDPNLDDVTIQGITIILDNRGYWSEVHLDREHTLTLVTGYDVKARHAINVRWLELETKDRKPKTQIELIIESAQALQRIEAEQIEQRNQLRAVEKQVARLTGESTHMAILAWATNNGLKIPISKSASMGKQAKAHCILKGIEYGTVKDERYGSVYTYPEDVLDLLFKPA